MKTLYILLMAIAFTTSGCKDLKDMEGAYMVMEVDGMDMTGKDVTLKLDIGEEKNSISGNNGCNEYSGSFAYSEDGVITMSPLMATKMYCMETADIEKAFMTQLNNTHKAKLNNDVLELKNAEGTTIIKARRIDE